MASDLVLRLCQVDEEDGGFPSDRHIAIADRFCIVQVDMNPSPVVLGIQGHYVLITAGNGADGYTIHDPWHAQVLSLPPAYCLEGWNAARAITRVTYWSPV